MQVYTCLLLSFPLIPLLLPLFTFLRSLSFLATPSSPLLFSPLLRFPSSSPPSPPLPYPFASAFPLLLFHFLPSPHLPSLPLSSVFLPSLASPPLLARYSRREAPSIEARSADKRGA